MNEIGVMSSHFNASIHAAKHIFENDFEMVSSKNCILCITFRVTRDIVYPSV